MRYGSEIYLRYDTWNYSDFSIYIKDINVIGETNMKDKDGDAAEYTMTARRHDCTTGFPPGYSECGTCDQCGSPIMTPTIWMAVTPPPKYKTCFCTDVI